MGARAVPVALTVAGSDSGGGAGIQADLRAFGHFQVFGVSVVTAITAQNPLDVLGVEPVSPEFVASQLRAVASYFTVKAAKTGMLHNAKTIAAAATYFKTAGIKPVVDPVAVSTSGKQLLRDDAVATLEKLLLPLAAWITPNRHEAELLLGRKLASQDDALGAAKELSERYQTGCVLKGGHFSGGGEAVDIVVHNGEAWGLRSPWVDLASEDVAHGTGCSFSSALAANLALGRPWQEALLAAKGYVHDALSNAVMAGGRLAMFPSAPSGAATIERF